MKTKILGLLLICSFLLAGCYLWADVEQDQVAARFVDNRFQECFGSGRYSDGGWTSELKTYSVGTLNFDVSDGSVATKDNQEVGVSITIQARRKGDCDSVRNFYTNYPHLLNDDALIGLMSKTALEGIKVGVRGMNIYQLLDDRNGLADAVLSSIQEDADQYNVEVVDVTINAVDPTAEFLAILNETANITAETQKELRRQELINQQAANNVLERQQAVLVAEEQLKLEQANTAVQVEIAEREGEVIRARNAIYQDNEQAFELARLEILRQTLNDKSVIYFLPETSDLNVFTSGPVPTVVPVVSP